MISIEIKRDGEPKVTLEVNDDLSDGNIIYPDGSNTWPFASDLHLTAELLEGLGVLSGREWSAIWKRIKAEPAKAIRQPESSGG